MKKALLRALETYIPPPAPRINQYKRCDVFRCGHDAHRQFNSSVSVYHVLKIKQCYPHGCVWFKWHCRKLENGKRCHRKFKHVGKACTSCPHFYDVKVIKRPEVMMGEQEFNHFMKELKAFESWIHERNGKLVSCLGTVNSVKPRYSLIQTRKKLSITFDGYLLNFHDSCIDKDIFHDILYVPITHFQQKRWRFARGDSLHFVGTFSVRHGLIIIEHIRSIEVLQRGEPCSWTDCKARIAQRTGSLLPFQFVQCYSCDKGVLIHVKSDEHQRGSRRRMLCLEGIADPRWCWYRTEKLIQCDMCGDETDRTS
ncbi:MAG: hypothetical protein N3B18_09375 [Desulfobacterota bacterium]|nr:hypothetical protein [Thermodesulfobacteriota bacterium]